MTANQAKNKRVMMTTQNFDPGYPCMGEYGVGGVFQRSFLTRLVLPRLTACGSAASAAERSESAAAAG